MASKPDKMTSPQTVRFVSRQSSVLVARVCPLAWVTRVAPLRTEYHLQRDDTAG